MLAGCSSGAVAGDAEPVGKAAGEPAFSPCDDIPDDVITSLGMDVATRTRDILDVHQPGWNVCAWNNDTHFLSVYATTYTVDDLRARSDLTDFAPVQIGGQDALAYRHMATPAEMRGDVAVASDDGMIVVSISDLDNTPSTPPPDQLALDTMSALLPHFPR
ncbi:DUF3558 domain-containing protein [Prescottella subtropica]|uniref:DUF3558 domain-containing protein n=1 Tax=Prescottella subtropica TaxID=2545757 RepID=UPI001F501357|nr:DUF3558 domain-containing protein [Prescottella subtropica]